MAAAASPASTASQALGLTSANLIAFEGLLNEVRCPLCRNADGGEGTMRDPHTTECRHTFCRTCLEEYLGEHHACPTCKTIQLRGQIRQNPHANKIRDAVMEIKAAMDALQARAALASPPVMMEIEPTERADDEEEEDEQPQRQTSLALSSPIVTTQQLLAEKTSIDDSRSRLQMIDVKLSKVGVTTTTTTTTAAVQEYRIFATSGLTSSQVQRRLEKLIIEFGNSEYTLDLSNKRPTHLIIGAVQSLGSSYWSCRSTAKYYLALSAGCWIIREEWLEDCEIAGRWLPEKEYHVYATSAKFDRNRLRSPPKLFQGKQFLLGPFAEEALIFTKTQSKELLELNGASVMDIDAGSLTSAILAELTDQREKIVIVGHPKTSDHSNPTCSFCTSLQKKLKRFGSHLRFVECAWIMACLDQMECCDFREREL